MFTRIIQSKSPRRKRLPPLTATTTTSPRRKVHIKNNPPLRADFEVEISTLTALGGVMIALVGTSCKLPIFPWTGSSDSHFKHIRRRERCSLDPPRVNRETRICGGEIRVKKSRVTRDGIYERPLMTPSRNIPTKLLKFHRSACSGRIEAHSILLRHSHSNLVRRDALKAIRTLPKGNN